MNYVETAFVVLIYRNVEDLKDYLSQLQKLKNSIAIIVNAHYDEPTDKNVANIVREFPSAVLLNVPNNGYSFGNNAGIEYVKRHYNFDYIIVSNADIEIKKFSLDYNLMSSGIWGPVVKTLTGKNQNPFRVVSLPCGEKFQYWADVHKYYKLIFLRIAVNKILREIFLMRFFRSKISYEKVNSLHGSFVIFSKDAIAKLNKVYYDKMFLFSEEEFLAYRCKKNHIPMYLTKKIEILHKEDGSMKISNINALETGAKSYRIYYEDRDKADKENLRTVSRTIR